MIGVTGAGEIGEVEVKTTSGRGLTVNELSDMALRKLIHIADTTPPAIRDQANAFKQSIREVLVQYMNQAIRSDRTTLHNQFKNLGFDEVADLIIKL